MSSRSLLLLIGFAVALVGCKGKANQPPNVADLTGPATGKPGEALVFSAVATDPEGDEVAYKFKWGDTSSIEWSAYYASGQGVTRTHTFGDTGSYVVVVEVRDINEAEAEGADSLLVQIRQLPPAVPARPSGPATCTTGVHYDFSTGVHHPQGDSVWFQFDWGGEVGEWRGPVASDSTHTQDHAFDSAATYQVSVRARDAVGAMSGWSEPLTVTAVDIAGGPPRNFAVAAASDSTLRLSWSEPAEGAPNSYVLSFKPVGGSGYEVVMDSLVLSFEHFPNGLTGTYKVAARFGTAMYEDTAVLSTVPIHTEQVSVYELNGTGDAGFGWNPAIGTGVPFSMTDTNSIPLVDLCVTNFDYGSGGMAYYLATPDTAVFDPTGIVPAGAWRRTWFTAQLVSEQDPLPSFADSTWRRCAGVDSDPMSFGVCTQDGYFAVVKVNQLRISQGYVRVQTWFQALRGLRLVSH